MQDAADEDAAILNAVENDVFFVLETAVSFADAVAGVAEFRRSGELMEGCFEAVEVPIGLIRAPGIDGVVGDFYQVEAGQL